MKNLLKISILYLLLPNLIFFYYWIFSPLNILLCISILGYVFYYLKQLKSLGFQDASFSKKEIIILLAIGFLWTVFSGVGGFVSQKEDFFMHNTKFTNLYNSAWPLISEVNQKYIIYYFGYYLVPAFIAKHTHQFSNLVIVLWSGVGFSLVIAWLYWLFDKNWGKIVVMLFIGGIAQFISFYIFHLALHIPYPIYPTFPMSLYEQSAWVPNQAIPTIICSAIFLAFVRAKLSIKLVVFPLCLMFLWAIFPTCILVFVILVWLLLNKRFDEIFSSTLFSIIPILAIIVPLLFYYSSSGGSGITGFIWNYMTPLDALFQYTRQILPDAIFFFVLIRMFATSKTEKQLGYLSLVLFLIFGMIRVGLYNDVFHRAIIVLYIFMFYAIFQSSNINFFVKKPYIAFLLLLSASISIKDFYKKSRINLLTTAPQKVHYEYLENETIYQAFLKINLVEGALEYCSKGDNELYERYLAPKK